MNKKGGRFWSEQEEKDLLRSYYTRTGGNNIEFSRAYGLANRRSTDSVRKKLNFLLEKDGVVVPESRHPDWDKAPEIVGDALILGDMHIPYHDAAHITRCIAAAKKFDVRTLILGGDALDARAFSHWPDDFGDSEKMVASQNLYKELAAFAESLKAGEREKMYDILASTQPETGNMGEEIETARDIFNVLDKNFDKIIWIMGNHEAWVTKTLKKTMNNADFARLFLGDNPKWVVSPHYWCRLTSDGEVYQIEHPTNSGKGSSKKLVSVFGENVIMLHNHHFSVQSDPSGRYLAVEPGMCADVNKIQYENQRHGTHDMHVVGGVLVRAGKIHLLNQFTDWSVYS